MITRKEELKRALEAGQNRIIVGGELAEKIRKMKQRKKTAKIVGGAIAAAGVVALPFTAGASSAAVAGGMGLALGGLTISAAELAIVVGGSICLYGAKKGYNIKFLPDGTVELNKDK